MKHSLKRETVNNPNRSFCVLLLAACFTLACLSGCATMSAAEKEQCRNAELFLSLCETSRGKLITYEELYARIQNADTPVYVPDARMSYVIVNDKWLVSDKEGNSFMIDEKELNASVERFSSSYIVCGYYFVLSRHPQIESEARAAWAELQELGRK